MPRNQRVANLAGGSRSGCTSDCPGISQNVSKRDRDQLLQGHTNGRLGVFVLAIQMLIVRVV